MKPKDIPFLIYDSIMNILKEPFIVLLSMKNIERTRDDIFEFVMSAKTWSFALYLTVIFMVYTRKWSLTYALVIFPLIILVYIYRRSREADFYIALKKRVFLKNNEQAIQEYYEKYKKECFYTKEKPLEYEQYKQSELKKIKENR